MRSSLIIEGLLSLRARGDESVPVGWFSGGTEMALFDTRENTGGRKPGEKGPVPSVFNFSGRTPGPDE